MAREINKKRVYKLLRFLVLSVSILFFVYWVYLTLTHESFSEYTWSKYNRCGAIYTDKISYEAVCTYYLDKIAMRDKWHSKSLIIATAIPTLFFGGKALISYIAPEEEK